MPINNNHINNNKNSFADIHIIILCVLFGIGGLYYHFIINNQPFEEPTQGVIEDNQETEKQEVVNVNNEYIPVIDNLWLNIPAFLIVFLVSFTILSETGVMVIISHQLNKRKHQYLSHFFGLLRDEKNKLFWAQYIIGYIIFHQTIFYIIWFILMFIFAGFSKIWDKEHSWWSNVKKGFFRNRLHRGWLSLIPISVLVVFTILLLRFVALGMKKEELVLLIKEIKKK